MTPDYFNQMPLNVVRLNGKFSNVEYVKAWRTFGLGLSVSLGLGLGIGLAVLASVSI